MSNPEKPRASSLPGRFFAEFLVIVLGVLVALGVDEWRQAQSEVREESGYLERLAADFAADVENWELVLSLLGPKEDALARIESWLATPNRSDESTLRTLAGDLATAAAFSGSVPPPRQSTYTELLSTGKLELIRDEAFRVSLIDYHFAFENFELRIASRTTGYEPLTYALVPREIRNGGDNVAREDLTFTELRAIADRALGLDLLSVVVAERNRARFLRAVFEELVEDARELQQRAEEG